MSKPIVSIRFIREAKEERVEAGIPGHRDPAKRIDRNYTIVHAVGKIMEVSESSATHWVARGVAERLGAGGVDDQSDAGTLPPIPGGLTLPPPPPGV